MYAKYLRNQTRTFRNLVCRPAGHTVRQMDGIHFWDEFENSGLIQNDLLDLDLRERFTNVINFIRSNRCAMISMKLKVLSSCVLSTLLYNCETFGNKLPKVIEKLLKLNVRKKNPNEIVLIESGFLPIQSLVKKTIKILPEIQEDFQDPVPPTSCDRNATHLIKNYSALDN